MLTITQANRKSYLIIGISILCYAVIFTYLSYLKYRSFFALSWEELATGCNIIHNTSKGDLFFNSFSGLLFSHHFSLLYLYLAPVYLLFPSIKAIFFSTHLWLAIGAFPVYLIGKRVFKKESFAFSFALFYLLSNPIHNLSFCDHDIVPIFTITPLFFAFYFFYMKKFRHFILSSLLVMSIIEYASLVIVMFGILSCFQRDRSLKWKIAPILLGVLWIFLVLKVFLPLSGYETYEPLLALSGGEGKCLGLLAQNLLLHPIKALQIIMSKQKAIIVINASDPALFLLAIFSPSTLMIGFPIFFKILLAKQPYYMSITSYNHIAMALPFVYISVIFSAKKILDLLGKIKNTRYRFFAERSIIFFLLLYAILTNFGDNILGKPSYMYRNKPIGDDRFLGTRNIYSSIFYKMDKQDKVAWKMISLIPAEASVSASGDLLAPLACRKNIYEFGTKKEIHDMDGHDFNVDFILLNTRNSYHGFDTLEVDNEESARRIDEAIRNGYRIKASKDSFILLEKDDHTTESASF